MQPLFAFTLVELMIFILILAILAALLGGSALDAIKKAFKAGGSKNVVGSWQSPAASVSADTPTTFTLLLQDQKLDSNGVVVSTDIMPQNTPAMFDVIVVTGSASTVSVTADGNPLPQAKSATAGQTISNVAGSTDTNGIIRIIITLTADTQVRLVAKQSPDPSLPGWTVAPITITAQ